MRKLKKWLWLIPVLGVTALAWVVLWAATPSGPMPEVLDAMRPGARGRRGWNGGCSCR